MSKVLSAIGVLALMVVSFGAGMIFGVILGLKVCEALKGIEIPEEVVRG